MSKNEKHMEKRLLEAAERGDAAAQLNLAIMYENELLDSRDAPEGNRSEAMKWLLAAAEQGLARAQVKLAEIYDREPNMLDGSVKACGWYSLAARGLRGVHLQKAQSAHQRAAKDLTPAQAAEVTEFVRDWKATITPNTMSARATEAGRRL
jgi:TPR repeat protein